jgi:uncharacterized membrane protein (UPF0127 family)
MTRTRALIIGGGRFKATADIDLATTTADKARGLSGRDVKDGEGMMFDSVGAYWMRGCKVSLDIVFAAKDGTILEIQTMPLVKPGEDLVLYRPKSSKPSLVFEFKEGWLRKKGVTTGDRIVVLGE